MTPRGRRARDVAAGAIGLTVLAVVLSGCGGGPVGDELYQQGREANLTFKSAVAAVQAEISPGDWRIAGYGDVPQDCDRGYRFSVTRNVPLEWRLSSTAQAEAERVGKWLAANGWTDIKLRTYSEGISDVIVQARNPDAGVKRLDVDIVPGEFADGVIITAESTCNPGDPDDLMAELHPGWPTNPIDTDPLPTNEAPDAPPVFGFTTDGHFRH